MSTITLTTDMNFLDLQSSALPNAPVVPGDTVDLAGHKLTLDAVDSNAADGTFTITNPTGSGAVQIDSTWNVEGSQSCVVVIDIPASGGGGGGGGAGGGMSYLIGDGDGL